jgi:hypothetical protein
MSLCDEDWGTRNGELILCRCLLGGRQLARTCVQCNPNAGCSTKKMHCLFLEAWAVINAKCVFEPVTYDSEIHFQEATLPLLDSLKSWALLSTIADMNPSKREEMQSPSQYSWRYLKKPESFFFFFFPFELRVIITFLQKVHVIPCMNFVEKCRSAWRTKSDRERSSKRCC